MGLILFIFLLCVSILAPYIAPYDPFALVSDAFVPPDSKFLMGTDHVGRDIYSGIIWGTRVSVMVGLLSAATAASIGIIIGSVAGYSGGVIDDLLMRATEFFQIVPRLVLALVIVALFGGSVWNVIVVIGLLSWPTAARLIRAQFFTLKERAFVEAAKSLGVGTFTMVFEEILPNAIAPVIVQTSLEVANAILLESMLSFLGLGDPSEFTWGYMLNSAQRYLRISWWMALFPGVAILTTVMALNLMGDGLNDALNPRLKER